MKLFAMTLLLLQLWGCGAVDKVPVPEADLPADDPVQVQPVDPAEPVEPTQPEVTPEPEIDESQLSANEKRLRAMTLEQKVGQVFLARCPETGAAEKAAQYSLGGYILFGNDFKDKTRQQVTDNIASYQQAAQIPMLMAVDEEGGTVNRVSRHKEFRSIPFKSPRELYKEGGFELIRTDTADKSRLLQPLGLNVNMAPVADVTGDQSAFMYKRSFSGDADEVTRYIRNVVTVMEAEGMGSVLKHFPGYGNAADSHTDITYDERPLEEFYQKDFLPFKEGIDAGVDAILVNHNIVKAMDDALPASLSPKVHEILRAELGFEGVIVTDDLYMAAISSQYDAGEAAVLALLAGNDLICCTEFELHIPAVLEAVQSGRIPEDLLDQAVLRVLDWKADLGLIEG